MHKVEVTMPKELCTLIEQQYSRKYVKADIKLEKQELDTFKSKLAESLLYEFFNQMQVSHIDIARRIIRAEQSYIAQGRDTVKSRTWETTFAEINVPSSWYSLYTLYEEEFTGTVRYQGVLLSSLITEVFYGRESRLLNTQKYNKYYIPKDNEEGLWFEDYEKKYEYLKLKDAVLPLKLRNKLNKQKLSISRRSVLQDYVLCCLKSFKVNQCKISTPNRNNYMRLVNYTFRSIDMGGKSTQTVLTELFNAMPNKSSKKVVELGLDKEQYSEIRKTHREEVLSRYKAVTIHEYLRKCSRKVEALPEWHSEHVTKWTLKDKHVFWDIDGTIADSPKDSKEGEILNGLFEDCMAKEHISIGYNLGEAVNEWLGLNCGIKKQRLPVLPLCSKAQAVVSYSLYKRFKPRSIVYVSEDIQSLIEAESAGVICYYISSFLKTAY